MNKLSNRTLNVARVIYKRYKQKVNEKESSRYFFYKDKVLNDPELQISLRDLNDCLCELETAGFITLWNSGNFVIKQSFLDYLE